MLNAELGLRDSILIELADCDRCAIQCRSDMLRSVESNKGSVNRILRPSIGTRAKFVADFAAELAGTDFRYDFLADRMLLCRVIVPQRLERMISAGARALKHRLPGSRVSFFETRK